MTKQEKTEEEIITEFYDGFQQGKLQAEKELKELQEAYDIAMKEISRLLKKLEEKL